MKKVGLAFRTLLALGLAWCVLVEIAEAFVGRKFGFRLDGDWFLMLAASSSSEISEFFHIYGEDLTLALSALVGLWAVIICAAFLAKGKWLVAFAAIALIYVGWNCRSLGRALTWPPVFMAYDTFCRTLQYKELLDAGTWKGDLLPGAAGRSRETATNIVFVIGESMTTDRMSLYGYAKKTTPFLDGFRDQMTVMGPVLATDSSTLPALRMLLTRATCKNPAKAIETAAVAFRRRGYRPVLISNQPRWGRRCGVGQMLFAACENTVYLVEREQSRGVSDGEIVPYLQREIAVDDDRPFVLFLHLSGSHFDPVHRVPPWFRTPEDFDAYDRSILYTDSVLSEIVRSLPPRTMMIYTSDHGETPDSTGWRDAKSPSLWKVPLVIWPKQNDMRELDCLDQVFDWLFDDIIR